MSMEIHGVSPTSSLDAVFAALAEIAAAEALSSVVPSGVPSVVQPLDGHLMATPSTLTHGAGNLLEHGPRTATAESNTPHPDARPDKGAETGIVQNFARPAPHVHEAPRPSESALAAPATGGTDFALPADQLINATVIGLAIEPSYGWPMQRRTDLPNVPAPRAEAPAVDPDIPRGGDTPPEHQEETAEPEPEHASAAPRSGVLPDAEPGDDWSEPLTLAIRTALRGKAAPRSLLAAAEQWKLGRCVVLACPQGSDPAGAAWAFVLWPRPGSRPGLPLALFGIRVDARVHWSRLPPALDWCHARVMKEQHPRQGRQLVALDAKGTAAVDCEVQLGPVPLRTPRWREACVRIDAVRRFWGALGEQWSVTVVVGSRPLLGAKEAPC